MATGTGNMMRGQARKQAVLVLHGHRCVYCGEQHDAADLTVDHVQPRVKGGDNSAGNLVACCRRCNAEKGGLAAWAFLATRPDRRRNFLRHARWIWPRLRRAVEESDPGIDSLASGPSFVYHRGTDPMNTSRDAPPETETPGTR
jgi:hypothetical protein